MNKRVTLDPHRRSHSGHSKRPIDNGPSDSSNPKWNSLLRSVRNISVCGWQTCHDRMFVNLDDLIFFVKTFCEEFSKIFLRRAMTRRATRVDGDARCATKLHDPKDHQSSRAMQRQCVNHSRKSEQKCDCALRCVVVAERCAALHNAPRLSLSDALNAAKNGVKNFRKIFPIFFVFSIFDLLSVAADVFCAVQFGLVRLTARAGSMRLQQHRRAVRVVSI